MSEQTTLGKKREALAAIFHFARAAWRLERCGWMLAICSNDLKRRLHKTKSAALVRPTFSI
jgi:hypothetical protein